MRTFLQTIIVSSIILGLSSCGLMIFGTKNKEAVSNTPKEDIKVTAKQETKEETKEVFAEAATLEVNAGINDVFYAATSIINRMGLITGADKSKGVIQANVRSAKVTIMMVPGQAKVVDISVNAVRDQGPDVELGSEILNKIKTQLAI